MLESDTGPKKQIELPSSGLAEDILSMLTQKHGAASDTPAEHVQAAPAVAQAVAEPARTEAKEGLLHLVTFVLGNEEYAVEIFLVQEIIRVSGWTRIPNAPDQIKGVINLRGRIIPVLDPKVKMGLPESEMTKSTRIMVVESSGKLLGILVDCVNQVIKVPTSVVEPPPEEVSRGKESYITGVGKFEGRLIILLDLSRVTGREEALAAAAIAEQTLGQ